MDPIAAAKPLIQARGTHAPEVPDAFAGPACFTGLIASAGRLAP